MARLAGVPDSVTDRAKEIVEELVQCRHHVSESKDIAVAGTVSRNRKQSSIDEVDLAQMSLFDTVKDDDVLAGT